VFQLVNMHLAGTLFGAAIIPMTGRGCKGIHRERLVAGRLAVRRAELALENSAAGAFRGTVQAHCGPSMPLALDLLI
jgi:hypothetical protein